MTTAPDTVTSMERAENTDKFTQSTKRCTRRAWDVFLSLREDLDGFNDRLVRARMELQGAGAAKEVMQVLQNSAGVEHVTQMDQVLECTTTLAAVQLVIKHADFVMFDCVLVD